MYRQAPGWMVMKIFIKYALDAGEFNAEKSVKWTLVNINRMTTNICNLIVFL